MAITFPRAFPSCAAFQVHKFAPRYQQTYAMSGGGSPQAADVGPAYWEAEFSVETLGRADTAEWDAWLHSLRGGLRTFKGRVPGHRWLMAYPTGYAALVYSGGPWSGSGNLASIAAERDAVTVDELPNGLVVGVGDFFSIPVGGRQHLHRVTEGGVSSAGSIAVSVEPTIRPNAVVDVAALFIEPWCEMTLIGRPSISISQHRFGSFSFQAAQVIK